MKNRSQQCTRKVKVESDEQIFNEFPRTGKVIPVYMPVEVIFECVAVQLNELLPPAKSKTKQKSHCCESTKDVIKSLIKSHGRENLQATFGITDRTLRKWASGESEPNESHRRLIEVFIAGAWGGRAA